MDDVIAASAVVTVLAFAAAVIGVMGAVLGLVNALIGHRTAGLDAGVSAPPALLSAVGSSLPGRLQLVNRDAEVAEGVQRLVAGELTLAIEGPFGIGKSAVANEIAHRLVGDGARTVLGECEAVWIDGRDHDFDLVDVCRRLALVTGDQSLTAAPPRDKLDLLRLHLSRNKTVVILDNLRVSRTDDALDRLMGSVPTGSRIIASVDRPGTQGARLALKELNRGHVGELIAYETDRLGLDDGESFDVAFADRLFALVGGNPRMVQWFLRSLRDSARSIDEHFEAVERGDGLGDMFAPFWHELPGDSRQALTACVVLKGQAIAEQIALMTGLSRDRTVSVIEALLSEGLLTTIRTPRQPNTYSTSPGLGRFVRAEVKEATIRKFARRLSDQYIERFGAAWEDAPGAIPHMAAIQPLLEELYGMSDNETLQALLWAVHDIFFSLGLFDDRIAAGDLGYHSAMRAGDHAAASRCCSMLANTHAIRGELDEARAAFALGVVAAAASRDPGEIARQRRCDGFLAYRARAPEQALRAIEGAEELAVAGGNSNSVVDILDLRAAALWYLGDADAAEATATDCLAWCNEIGWRRAIAFPLRFMAEAAAQRGDFSAARDLLDRAHRASVEHEDRRQLVRLAVTRARIGLVSGDLEAAVTSAAEAEAQALALRLPPEAEEARALRHAARRALWFPMLRRYYMLRRPSRLTGAPVGGD